MLNSNKKLGFQFLGSIIFPVLLVFSHSLAGAQTFQGTWMAYYNIDEPLNKRQFYYRLLLEQQQDSVFGICEALDARSDINGVKPEDARIAAKFVVFSRVAAGAFDTAVLTLFTGNLIENFTASQSFVEMPPIPKKLVCRVLQAKPRFSLPQLQVALLPVPFQPEGFLSMVQLSKYPVNLMEYQALNFSFKNLRRRKKMPLLAAVREKQQATEKPADLKLPPSERSEVVFSTLELNSREITVKVFDNGVIDDDTVSVLLNDSIIINRQRLSAKPIAVNLQLKKDVDNKIVLWAHNMGSIPPNTALLLIETPGRSYAVNLASTFHKSGVVLMHIGPSWAASPQQPN